MRTYGTYSQRSCTSCPGDMKRERRAQRSGRSQICPLPLVHIHTAGHMPLRVTAGLDMNLLVKTTASTLRGLSKPHPGIVEVKDRDEVLQEDASDHPRLIHGRRLGYLWWGWLGVGAGFSGNAAATQDAAENPAKPGACFRGGTGPIRLGSGNSSLRSGRRRRP